MNYYLMKSILAQYYTLSFLYLFKTLLGQPLMSHTIEEGTEGMVS